MANCSFQRSSSSSLSSLSLTRKIMVNVKEENIKVINCIARVNGGLGEKRISVHSNVVVDGIGGTIVGSKMNQ